MGPNLQENLDRELRRSTIGQSLYFGNGSRRIVIGMDGAVQVRGMFVTSRAWARPVVVDGATAPPFARAQGGN
jgi:hypothetical protein